MDPLEKGGIKIFASKYHSLLCPSVHLADYVSAPPPGSTPVDESTKQDTSNGLSSDSETDEDEHSRGYSIDSDKSVRLQYLAQFKGE